MTDSVLIIGAGELGMCMLEAVAAHPLRPQVKRLSVLVRAPTADPAAPPEKQQAARRIQELGAELETADVVRDSTEELAALLSRYDTVLSCTGMELPPGTQAKLADAALAGGVRRYFPWQYGMDYDAIGNGSSQQLFDEQLGVRAKLRAGTKTTEWVIVSTGLFMSFLFVRDYGVVDLEAKTVRALGSWDREITLTTPRDIGRVAAEAVLDPRDIKNQVVYTAGDTLTYGQLADTLDAHYKTKFRRELWDEDTLRRQVEANPADGYAKYREVFGHGVGVAWPKSGTLNAQRSMAMTSVEDHLRETDIEFPRP
ncbi:hypothetical protein HIM_04108 [Hirsutella minnesotensis 3608]|uniref:NmrA-like domain-containing protein n=1 Tax=Hirsutella minnesotensis 3608 TaxID=1043627 RepID=A0A0F8A633_9HYPO|nr:hypothetical protein HIM_04108 [Hirsutella minnesotensis 3608]